MSDIPRVFIGSSQAGYDVAEMMTALLRPDVMPHLWTNNLFRAGAYALETLEEQVRTCKYAIIIATPDDLALMDSSKHRTLQPDSALQLGLFLGAMGRQRAYLLVPDSPLHVPDALSGLTIVRYNHEHFLSVPSERNSTLSDAVFKFKDAIRLEEGKRAQDLAARERKLKQSERYAALQRLDGAISDLNEIVVLLQGDLLSSVLDSDMFSEKKRAIATKTQDIAFRFIGDADLLGVRHEFDSLVDATMSVIQAFPFPDQFIMTSDQYTAIGIDLGKQVYTAALSGAPYGKTIGDTIEQELARRMQATMMQYQNWWSASRHGLDLATRQLRVALLKCSMEMNRRSLDD